MLHYWILFALSGLILFLIFWRRYLMTKKSMLFEAEMLKEQAAEAKRSESHTPMPHTEAPTDLELQRKAEQRVREEQRRRLLESKKAFKRAEVHFSKGEYPMAEKFLLQVLSFDNDHLDANLKLGLLYLHQDNLPRAEFFFQKLVDLKEHPVYFSNLALTLYQQKRLEESAKLYERAIALDEKKATRFVSLAYVYHELGELEKAMMHFEQASGLEPRNLEYLWTLVDYYEKFGRLDEAFRTLRRILDLDPYNQDARDKLARMEDALPQEEEEGE